MTNKPKQIGTRAESAVVRFLQPNGFPHAERRALRGELDAGDITGTPGVCWEVKGGNAARNASDAAVVAWLEETEVERVNARADIGVLVLQRKAVGERNAGRWWAILPAQSPLAMRDERLDFPVRMLLSDVVRLLRSAGYGTPLEQEARPS